ncbi:hypothetical protein GX586_16135 [bacterium]|nr:hypothetical protein [bacterium]
MISPHGGTAGSKPTLGIVSNCVIRGNACNKTGGGIVCDNGGRASWCSVNGNGSETGGGIYCMSNGVAEHCSVFLNAAGTSPEIAGENPAASFTGCYVLERGVGPVASPEGQPGPVARATR